MHRCNGPLLQTPPQPDQHIQPCLRWLALLYRLLLRLFPTRVKLLKPPPGPLAVQHQQQIEQDAAQQLEEDSYRAAAAVAASTGVSIPPKASGIYAGSASASASKQPMRKPEWRKVLSWAVAMETLQAKQRQLQLEQQQEEAAEQDSAAAQVVPNGAAALAPAGSTASSTEQTPLSAAGLRRRRGPAAPDAAHAAAPPANGRRAHTVAPLLPSPLSLAGSLWRALNPLHLAAAAVALPWRLGAAAAAGAARLARVCVCRLPLVGGAIEDLLTVLESSQLEAELAELEAELAALDLPGDADSLSLEADVDGFGGGDSGHTGGGATTGTLQLSEASVRYGLSMLQRSSPDIKQSVRPSNSYERQLLAEVTGHLVLTSAAWQELATAWCLHVGWWYHVLPPHCLLRYPSSASHFQLSFLLPPLLSRFLLTFSLPSSAFLYPSLSLPCPGPSRSCPPRNAGEGSARWEPWPMRRRRCGRRCSCPCSTRSCLQAAPWPDPPKGCCSLAHQARARRWLHGRQPLSAAPPSSPSRLRL